MEQSNKIERSEAWNNIYEVLARLDLKESTGDALDRPSAATEIEALFLKLLGLQNVSTRVFSDHFLQKATKLTLIEKIVLKFKKKLYYKDDIESITIVYKRWRGKTYILNHYNNPPMHPMCRCSLHGC